MVTSIALLRCFTRGLDVNVDALLRGAADFSTRCVSSAPEENPALLLAALYYLLDKHKGKRISVMMPYVNRLRLFADWYCQLARVASSRIFKERSLSDVIHAEFRATRQVITDAGHPNMTLQMPVLDAYTLGQLIDLYQRTAIYASLLYGINPIT
ncbi:MAG: hypothetical protein ACYDDO_09150 [Acidiferrobacterales bacterium]